MKRELTNGFSTEQYQLNNRNQTPLDMKERILETLRKALGQLVNNELKMQLQPIPVRVNNRFGR